MLGRCLTERIRRETLTPRSVYRVGCAFAWHRFVFHAKKTQLMGSRSAPLSATPLLRQQLLPLDAGLVVGCNALPNRPFPKRLEHILNQLGVSHSTVLLNLAGFWAEPFFGGWDMPSLTLGYKPEVLPEFARKVAEVFLRALSFLEYCSGI